ncbi:MAG: hypothetical protein BGN92_02705 [Sphingobacteriales bacterium 41-5]|nr:MAG: hypothetical protein BGN92_02705 [Sphingobacteriales bacterium 41-5]
MVPKEGFPIAYEIFSGNTFEGHTIIPVVKSFIQENKVKDFTVVADAAMISDDNIIALQENTISYIVGARLGSISQYLVSEIDKNLQRQDGKSIRIKTDKGYLICSYSAARYRKNKYEMDKQIEKAKYVIDNPSKNKRLKFTKADGQKIELNEKLIDKTEKMLGIKGYYTNLEESIASNTLVIERYHELYKIEHAFRIAKSDLQTRPIFHYKGDPIKLHLLICFMALVLARHIELKEGVSIRSFIHECKKITTARLKNQITGKEIRLRAKPTPPILKIIEKFDLLT